MYLIQLFFSQIRQHKIRFIACILGFSVALGTIFTINSYTEQFSNAINRVYFVEQNSVIIMEKGVNLIQQIPFESRIPENITTSLSLIPGVSYSIPVIFKNLANESKYTWIRTIIVGIDYTILRTVFLQNIALKFGRWAIADQNETVVGPLIKEDGSIRVGDQILVQGVNLTITGILESNNAYFDRFIYCDYDFIQKIYKMPNICTMIYVLGNSEQFQDGFFLDELEITIETQYPTANLIDQRELDGFLGNYYAIIDMASTILAIFPMVIGIIFLFILMMLNVKDQEREFGMLRALGMSSIYIGGIVFGQAVIITFIGYLISLGIGLIFFTYGYYVVAQHTVNFANPFVFAFEMMRQVPSKAYWRTLLLSTLLGFGIAIYPSIKAMHVNIVQSFRKEV